MDYNFCIYKSYVYFQVFPVVHTESCGSYINRCSHQTLKIYIFLIWYEMHNNSKGKIQQYDWNTHVTSFFPCKQRPMIKVWAPMVRMSTSMYYTHRLSRLSLCSHSKEKVNASMNKGEGGDFSMVLLKGCINLGKREIIAFSFFIHDLG